MAAKVEDAASSKVKGDEVVRASSSNPFSQSTKNNKYTGGEGVLLMNAAAKGYWKETALAYHGRPAPVMVLTMYFFYVAGCVSLSMFVNKDDDDKAQIILNSNFAAISAPALFFLLVFRTNAAYDRWWEGRKHWGMIINRTRDFARQAVAYIGDDWHVERMIRYTIAFSIATKVHLRTERDMDEMQTLSVLSLDQIVEIQKAKHMPNFVLSVLSDTMQSARAAGLLSDIGVLQLDKTLTQYEDDLGACERIMKTKMPFAYVVHLRAFLILWLVVLPWCLVYDFEWKAIPACLLAAYALFGLDSIGVDIENPFGHDFNDLPLDDITNKTICRNLFEILERHQARRRRQSTMSGSTEASKTTQATDHGQKQADSECRQGGTTQTVLKQVERL